jgi:RecA/RadA recombinase
MTYEGIFDETDCKKELKRAKKYIKKQADIIFVLEKEVEEKNNEIIIIKERLKSEKLI